MLKLIYVNMFLTLPWWTSLLIYLIVFVIIAFVFQALDFSKILREEYKNFTFGMLIYFIFTIIATFLVGTMLLELISIVR